MVSHPGAGLLPDHFTAVPDPRPGFAVSAAPHNSSRGRRGKLQGSPELSLEHVCHGITARDGNSGSVSGSRHKHIPQPSEARSAEH